MWLKRNFPFFSLVFIVLVGAWLRFYKLDWGAGYFFHPDEYHIAAAVNQLSFPFQMNPHFFAYGSFIVYLIYFTKLVFSIFNFQSLILNPFLIGRFWSALFSTLTVILIYLISFRLFPKRGSLAMAAAALCALMPGLIQQAHFATPESILTFWLVLALYLGIRFLNQKRLKFLYFMAISLGLALGTKIVALAFMPLLPALSIINWRWMDASNVARQRFQFPRGEFLVRLIKLFILPLILAFLIFFLVFPYSLLDWRDFHSSMNYEIGVGQGSPVVFYTRQFINTRPLIFQFKKIFPYALGPGILILGFLGFLMVSGKLLKKKTWLVVVLAFLSIFLANAFLFAKWTRFMAPSFPFFALFAVYVLSRISEKRIFLRTAVWFLLAVNFIWSLMFFSIYLRPDVRIRATAWLRQRLFPGSFILTEAGNMLEVPLKGDFQKTAFDFYHLEEEPKLQYQLPELLSRSSYFIIQSRRIFYNHRRLPNQFPKTSRFYDLLFSGQLGFKKIKEFNSYPQFSIFNFQFSIPDEKAEETWSVFDHPVIRIYKKVKLLSKKDYENLLQI